MMLFGGAVLRRELPRCGRIVRHMRRREAADYGEMDRLGSDFLLLERPRRSRDGRAADAQLAGVFGQQF